MKRIAIIFITVIACALLLVSCELPFDIPGMSREYTVTYYDGEEVYTEITSANGEVSDLPDAPEKGGYEFLGWFLSNGEDWDPDTHTEGDVKVYSKFKTLKYEIKYVDSLRAPNPNPKEYTAKDNIELQPLTKSGYNFVGWFTDAGRKEPFSGKIDAGSFGDLKLYTKWEEVTYTITLKVDGSTVGEVKYTVSDKTLDLPEVPERVGYSGSWIYDEALGDKVASAVYELISYKINYEGLFGASNVNNRNDYTIETSDFAIAPPSSNTDNFVGWYLDRECTILAPESVAKGSFGEITVYAKWNCDHDHVGTVKVKPLALKEGIMTYNCKNCLNSYEAPIPATKSIKLLSIGNSFSVDALEHLGGILVDLGVENITIMNLYIGGCTLDRHWNNMSTGGTEYTLYSFDRASLKMKTINKAANVEDTLALEDWDIITLQQQSANSGKPSSFGNLENVINFVRTREPGADLYWHMTWAYQEGDSRFGSNYNGSQVTMYEAIADTVNNVVLKTGAFVGVIPSGTAIQNMRTGSLGDNLNRDGLHLSYGAGRYTAAMTWAAILTGADISKVSWTPADYPDVALVLSEIKAAVKAAVAKPYEITDIG
jgi:uncharacterized repeat protein (TIGR02543 family)